MRNAILIFFRHNLKLRLHLSIFELWEFLKFVGWPLEAQAGFRLNYLYKHFGRRQKMVVGIYHYHYNWLPTPSRELMSCTSHDDHHSWWLPFMMTTTHDDHHSWWLPLMMTTTHDDHHSWWPPLMMFTTHVMHHSRAPLSCTTRRSTLMSCTTTCDHHYYCSPLMSCTTRHAPHVVHLRYQNRCNVCRWLEYESERFF